MPNVVSPLLSLIVDIHGAQTIPSIFDSVARKSIFGLRKQDAPKIQKQLEAWDFVSHENSSACEEIVRVVPNTNRAENHTTRVSSFAKSGHRNASQVKPAAAASSSAKADLLH